MKYMERALERKFLRMSSFFKAVLVTGARQVGKTTMLKHLAAEQSRTYVSMDNAMARELAKSDSVLFFQIYKPPIIIDEIQKAPELFEQIKVICDGSEERGLFWLTGSQQYKMMKNIRETLAGRIGILELYSLSKNEVEGLYFPNEMDLLKYSSIFGVEACRMRFGQMQSKGRNILIRTSKPISCGMSRKKGELQIRSVSINL